LLHDPDTFEIAARWIPGTRPGMTRRLAWRLKLKFDVIPALVAGIQLSAILRGRLQICASTMAQRFSG